MENEKKASVLQNVLLVFGIIFSIILVPGLIVGIPTGGATIALSQSVSQEGIETMIREAKVSEYVYDLLMDELENEVTVEELKPEFWNGLMTDSITLSLIDDIVMEFVDCTYNGTEPQLDVSGVTEGFRKGITDLTENGFDDIYAACFEGAESKFFSAELIRSMKDEVETRVLSEFSEYGVTSLEELETMYDAQFGAGSYEKLWNEKIDEVRTEWEDEFLSEMDGVLESSTEELEQELNAAVREVAQDPEIRPTVDMLREISAKKETIKLVVYGIVLASVLLLLVCFWFKTAGFVVPSVALILGGLLCKLITLLEAPVLTIAKDAIVTEPGMEEIGDMVLDIVRGMIAPFFAEMSKFGLTMIGIGVLLVLLAILRGVIVKNMHAAGDTM